MPFTEEAEYAIQLRFILVAKDEPNPEELVAAISFAVQDDGELPKVAADSLSVDFYTDYTDDKPHEVQEYFQAFPTGSRFDDANLRLFDDLSTEIELQSGEAIYWAKVTAYLEFELTCDWDWDAEDNDGYYEAVELPALRKIVPNFGHLNVVEAEYRILDL